MTATRDITERRQQKQTRGAPLRAGAHIQEALRRNGEELRRITDRLPLAFAYVDSKQRYCFTNKEYEEWVQRTGDEIMGRQVREILGEQVFKMVRGRVETVLSGEQVMFEATLPYREKGSRDVVVTYSPDIGERGEVEGFFAFITDVTDRKQAEEALRESEERFRVSLTHSPVVVFRQDVELRYTWIHNPVRGFKAEDILGKADSDLLPLEEASRLTALKRQVLRSGVGTREEIQGTVDGQTLYHDLTLEPLRDEKGTIMGITGASFDITVHKQEELREAREELEGKVDRKLLQKNPYGLTFREFTVLHLVATGRADKQIAHELGISRLTIHKHVASILNKMNAASRTEAGVRGVREGLLD